MGRSYRAFAFALLLTFSTLALAPPASAQDDAGSGSDAAGSFAAATFVSGIGRFHGQLVAGDEDWFRFAVAAGASIDIDLNVGLSTGQLGPNAPDRRLGAVLYDPLGVPLDNPNTNPADSRVTWPRALLAGEYRLQLDSEYLGSRGYSFCFVVTGDTCATLGLRPVDLLTPLPVTHAEVLLVPPIGLDPGTLTLPPDYLAASLAGIRAWDDALDAFAERYPQYAYLGTLEAHVELFDGAPQRAGYDVVIVWSPYTGPLFRGVASDPWGGGVLCVALCSGVLGEDVRATLEPVVHDGTRVIVMSSFAAAPRGGQVMPDFPEEADIKNVMQHEFAHTWGLGHTQTWTAAVGPDLMNSPYSHVFGDGDLLGDGGERTAEECITSLDLYGMARLYEWVGRGVSWGERVRASSAALPASIPYEPFCGA